MRIVIISTSTCIKCKYVLPKFIEALPEEFHKFLESYKIGECEEALILAERYNVRQAPTILIFKDGQEEPSSIYSGDILIPQVIQSIQCAVL